MRFFGRGRKNPRLMIPDREWRLLDDMIVELNRLRQDEKKATQLLVNAMTVKAGHGSDLNMKWRDGDGEHVYGFTMNGNSKSAKAGREMISRQLDDIRAEMFTVTKSIHDWHERNSSRLRDGRITLKDRFFEWIGNVKYVMKELNEIAFEVQGDDFLEAALLRESPIRKKVMARIEARNVAWIEAGKEESCELGISDAPVIDVPVQEEKPVKQEKSTPVKLEKPELPVKKKSEYRPSDNKKSSSGTSANLHRQRKSVIITTFNGWEVPLLSNGHREMYDAVRYAFRMEPYTKSTEVTSRAKDIASRLAVKSVSVSLSETEKNTVYIDVPIPPKERKPVLYKDIDFEGHQNQAYIGIDMGFNPVWKTLEELSHMLVAGTTGSGKSAFMRTFICSLIQTSTPDSLNLYLIDPKMGAEFHMFSASRYLWKPVVDDPDMIPEAMEYTYDEMNRRYEVIRAAGKVKLADYNESVSEKEKLPELLVVMDEVASVFAKKTYGKEEQADLEFHTKKIAAMGRAAGVRLLFATQRPTKDCLPTNILANLPTRVALHVDNQMNSRLILGEEHGEAANLLGNGDLLFNVAPDGVRHLQAAFLDPDGAEKLVMRTRRK